MIHYSAFTMLSRTAVLRAFFLALLGLFVSSSSSSARSTGSALKIRVVAKPSVCEQKASVGDLVSVHYVGSLEGGEQFDSSYSRGEPLPFTLGASQVIAGWDQGITGMCVGEKRELTIPPELAYGDKGAGGIIPGGATLTFSCELVKIG